jgi:5'(3')-deoxyribonucleotidase
MIVLLDCDGVAADFVGEVVRIVKYATGQDYAITKWLKLTDIPCSSQQRAEIAYQIGIMGRDLQVLPGAQDGVKALREAGHDVHWVTSRWDSQRWVTDRCWWLKEHGLVRDPQREITFTAAKWRVHGDIFVDDKPSNVAEWQSTWPRGYGLLFAQPWNQDVRVVRKVANWPDLVKFVEWRANRGL